MSVNVLTDDGLVKIAGGGGGDQQITNKLAELENLISELNQKVDSITKESLGLGNVDNTHDADKNVNSSVHISATVLMENEDLNNYKDTGYYRCASNDIAKSIVNSPTNNAFGMAVYANNPCMQEITEYTEINPKKFFRTCYGYPEDKWSPWYRIYTEADPQP